MSRSHLFFMTLAVALALPLPFSLAQALAAAPARTVGPGDVEIAQARSTVSDQDQTFAAAAARGSAAQILLGRLAEESAEDPRVKAFAARMVDEHRKLMDRLRQLGDILVIELPDQPTMEAQNAFDRLDGLSGATFDRSYMDIMVKDHETAIALFAKEQQSGEIEPLRSLAEETLPELRTNLDEAEGLRTSLPSG